MPLEIRPGVTIRRPRREVAAVMLDPRHEASWLETFARVEADDHDPPRRLVRFLLRPRPIALRVTGHDPERFVEWQAEEPWPIFVRQDMESIPEGTLVRIRLRVVLSGLTRLFKPMVARRLRRSLIADLETLKGLVENSPHRGMAAARPATAPGAEPPAAAAPPPEPAPAPAAVTAATVTPAAVTPPATAVVASAPVAAAPVTVAAAPVASMAAAPAATPAPATRAGTTTAPAADALNAAPSTVKADTTLRPPAWRTKATKVNW